MEVQTVGMTAIKPPGWDRKGCEAFRYLLYNPDTGEILTRTPLSWLKIILFYTVYYFLLAAFWVACLQIFFTTLPEGRPRWTLGDSIIGTNPGVGIRPRQQDKRIESSIYVLAAASADLFPTNSDGEGEKNIDFAVRLEKYLDGYQNGEGLVDCSAMENAVNNGTESCLFDLAELGECAEYPYGYVLQPGLKLIEPCFLLKFNKIYDWSPVPINPENLDLPKYDDMSEQLKLRIRKSYDKNFVWLECKGRNPADREALSFSYYPANQGISLKYFPFRGGDNYQAPLVAIKVHPKLEHIGQLIHMECRAWFDDVVHDTKDKLGLVQFELHILPMN